MSAGSPRRRSGVWESEVKALSEGSKRLRWTKEKPKKEPSMFDDWVSQDPPKAREPAIRTTPNASGTRLTPRGTTSSGPTIRAVTPETEGLGMSQHASGPERNLMSFERNNSSHAASSSTSTISREQGMSNVPRGENKGRKLLKERGSDRETRPAQTSSPSSRSGHHGSSFLGRKGSGSKKNGQRGGPDVTPDNGTPAQRPRTRTLEDRRREHSPITTTTAKGRARMGSLQANSPPKYPDGAQYLASVPAPTRAPSAPSIAAYLHSPESADRAGSPHSSGTADSFIAALPNAKTKRIVHLMKTLHGKMSGNIVFRRGSGSPWSQCYAYIHEKDRSLMYESRGSVRSNKALIPDLHMWTVACCAEGDTPYMELKSRISPEEVHLKLQTQPEFDAWFAALLHWQPVDPRAPSSNSTGSDSEPSSMLPSLAEKAEWPPSATQRGRADSSRSDTRKIPLSTAPHKDNPVIKIGKMICWDTAAGYTDKPVINSALGQPATVRPQAFRMQSVTSRRWRRISGQLRENGELKLHSDADNSLITVIQLSQLSRCAIQRLDPSVLDNDFCIAIYPQYTATYTSDPQGLIRPIFFSLENRVLHEVWYVLLRAFTMPSIYGPRMDSSDGGEDSQLGRNHDLENMIATSTTYTFRMERSLHVRVIEARMMPPVSHPEPGANGLQSRGQTAQPADKSGYYADILLDNEIRGKTVVKYGNLCPLWGENFEFQDLPPVLSGASVIVKRRPPEAVPLNHQNESRIANDAYSSAGEQQGGYTTYSFDVTCGKVEIRLEELEPDTDVEQWWVLVDMYGQKVGEVLIKVRAEEGIILMARDYQPLSQLLHRFTNALTSQIAEVIPQELKRVSDCLLNIFQVSGKASEWLMALVEEEIDGIDKETPISRLRYTRRLNSNESGSQSGLGSVNGDRELIVRDMNKSANNEANVLFRGNTLLTKSLDTHMRRVGKEYLEASLATIMDEINEKDPECEVDPIRVSSPADLDRNRRRLLIFTQEVWKAILKARSRCPIELRIVFRHIRACAEDKFGDFARNVSFTSVSGFLFLRFLCPAILNPKLFGLLKDDIKPRSRRTFTLIAKTIQNLANMVPAGSKESWMECMNPFLVQHRESFKSLIDDLCYVPPPLPVLTSPSSPTSPTYAPGLVSTEQHLSYTTPMTIMQRLPPSSREGFPSLPYLIDQARSFAELIHLWLEATAALSNTSDAAALPGKTHADVLAAIHASDGDLKAFHQLCEALSNRTQECLTRAERAERPQSASSFQWEEIIDQLQQANMGEGERPTQDRSKSGAPRTAAAPTMLREEVKAKATVGLAPLRTHETEDTDDEQHATRLYDPTPPRSRSPAARIEISRATDRFTDRPGSSSMPNSFGGGNVSHHWAHTPGATSPVLSTSASLSNASSIFSTDTEHSTATTALPSYEREIRHRERRERARREIQQQVEASQLRAREKERDRKKVGKLSSALRKKKLDREGSTSRTGLESSSSLAVNHGTL